jgi:hypothetical protein
MALMPDDEPDLNPPTVILLIMSIFRPCQPMTALNPPGPIFSPEFPRSRQTMASFLGIVAGMLGAASWSPAAGAACAVITLWP